MFDCLVLHKRLRLEYIVTCKKLHFVSVLLEIAWEGEGWVTWGQLIWR